MPINAFVRHSRIFLTGIQITIFLFTGIGPFPVARADEFHLPPPGVMVNLSPTFDPPILKGLKVHPDNPFKFDFILNEGDSTVIPTPPHRNIRGQASGIQNEAIKLIKYFLASLTIPEKDLWV